MSLCFCRQAAWVVRPVAAVLPPRPSRACRQGKLEGMSKSDKTYMLEETIALATAARGRIGCPEVGFGDEGIVDYVTLDLGGDRTVMCFELKITRSDFLSDAKKTFVGDLNYYVIPTSLWNSVRAHIEPGVGCWCVDDRGQATCMLEARRRECSLDRTYVARKLIFCLCREHRKHDRREWDERFSKRGKLGVHALRECFPAVMDQATDRRGRYGAPGVRLPSSDARSGFATVDMTGKGYVRCYQFKGDADELAEGPSGLAGDFNFYVIPLSLWGQAREDVPRWIGIWCLDEHGRAIRKRAAKHVTSPASRAGAAAAIAIALDRERMSDVERSWRERQYSLPVLDRGHSEVGVGDRVRYGGGTWAVRRMEHEREGTVLVPMLVLESERYAGVTERVAPRSVRKVVGDGN